MRIRFLAFTIALFLLAPAGVYAQTAKVEWGVNFRSAPSLNSQVYRMIPKGETVDVIEQVNRYWLKVRDKNGKVGYISADAKYTDYSGSTGSTGNKTVSPGGWEAKADAIIATAKSLIGKVDYKYGVRDPNRLIFDCSAFVQYVFQQHGIAMKWGTRYQKDMGQYVSKSDLRKGDLVFFRIGNSSSIGHVGIYLGNDKFIHNSPSGGGVNIANLDGYWDSHYVTARRVIQ